MAQISLNAACSQLHGVGPQSMARLARCGINTVADLLWHLPSRYDDCTQVTPIAQLQANQLQVIDVEVMSQKTLPGRRGGLVCHVQDTSGKMTLRFFQVYPHLTQQLSVGSWVRCCAVVQYSSYGVSMVHPEYQCFNQDESPSLPQTLTPVYPSTEGLSQKQWRHWIEQALQCLPLPELMPMDLLAEKQLPDINAALRFIHAPTPDAKQSLQQYQHPSQQRIVLDELSAHHMSLQRIKQQWQTQQAPACHQAETIIKQFKAQLSFDLTQAQARVAREIETDLQKTVPMQRLVQGDVGSGKTVVAALAALQAINSGWQVAFMAPTEILAEQHILNLQHWLTPLNITVIGLTGKTTKQQREKILALLAAGEPIVLIGTHALIQQDVVFAKLGLMIIDEQHRFGVAQRLALQKNQDTDYCPHQLVMTATPIPRTLAMTWYADLATSVIDELPPGRQTITTAALSNTRRDAVLQRIRELCQQGRQAYWVCTLINESEHLQSEAAETSFAKLQATLPELKIALLHGRMTHTEKETIMQAFKSGELHVLVATTVIEVGVDVPNASLIVIENPERLGLAQLHQLRGRVGRGQHASYCVLLYQSPLSETAKQRLTILRESNDGFVIAEEDLKIRGPGEVLGTRQTGDIHFRVADLMRDHALIPLVLQCGQQMLQTAEDDTIVALLERWRQTLCHTELSGS